MLKLLLILQISIAYALIINKKPKDTTNLQKFISPKTDVVLQNFTDAYA
jgi:hypothetical protein